MIDMEALLQFLHANKNHVYPRNNPAVQAVARTWDEAHEVSYSDIMSELEELFDDELMTLAWSCEDFLVDTSSESRAARIILLCCASVLGHRLMATHGTVDMLFTEVAKRTHEQGH